MATVHNTVIQQLWRCNLNVKNERLCSMKHNLELAHGCHPCSLIQAMHSCIYCCSRKIGETERNFFQLCGRRNVLFSMVTQLPVMMVGSLELKNGKYFTFGFDGLGNDAGDYATAKVVGLVQAGEGALLFLKIEGFERPLQMTVGAAEAIAILTASQERRTSRPVTHEAWSLSLAAVGWKVDRVAVTALKDNIFYSRVVLSSTQGTSSAFDARSVDVRPSDGIALALRCRAPLFVCKEVAKLVVKLQKPLPDMSPRQPLLDATWTRF